jgi:Na+/H+ antiporter NhaD/arsenite permease-like protein
MRWLDNGSSFANIAATAPQSSGAYPDVDVLDVQSTSRIFFAQKERFSMAESETINLSPRKFLIGCAVASAVLLWAGFSGISSPIWVAVELILTILGLFFLGSFKYQLDKNALTYGMGAVVIATFIPFWWPHSILKTEFASQGASALWPFLHHHFLSLHGLEELIHADTMLFILGLTFFVAIIAQTRILESASGVILRQQKGRVLPTIALLSGLVALCSGILDGVSMIGLMIRTLVIILALGRAQSRDIIFAVIVSTVITTVSGAWMAYGEPPNLIMKANLYPHLDNAFFLRYCAPIAFGTYLIVIWNLRKRLGNRKVELKGQDILDARIADVRFLQASRHGETFTPLEFVEQQQDRLGRHYIPVHERVLEGEPIGEALIREEVPLDTRLQMMGHFVSEELADSLEHHYQHMVNGIEEFRDASELKIRYAIDRISPERIRTQKLAALAFLPFIALLIAHAINHQIPLFLASTAGFLAAFLAIYKIPKMRRLAIHEAIHEYKEYLFLFPLFLGITLLQKTGFFEQLAHILQTGITRLGEAHVAYIQYWGACLLSAILDNNVVADFASKALHGLELGTMYLFSMAQIAGYAIGGCWTHIGCAQSVVAFAFIRKEISPRYTPVEWMKSMTVIVFQMSFFVTLVVYLEGWFLKR